MEKQSLIPVSATTKPTNQKEFAVKHSNKFCWDRSLVDQLGEQSMMATYGSGSLDATSSTTTTTTRQDVEDCPSDGILKNPSEDQEGEENNTNEALESQDSPYVYYFGGSNSSSAWKTYLGSWRFVELLVCVVPCLAVFLYFEVSDVKPRIRPIPVQQIYTIDGGEIRSNDYSSSSSSNGSEGFSSHTNLIWNPVNTESWSGDTVGHRQYQILFGLCPWLLQALLVWYLARARRRPGTNNRNSFCFWDALHRTTCMYFVGIGITDGLTNCIKYYVGYLRPIFLERCQPYYDETDSTVKCSIHNSHTLDARVSFPSNHSAWSFCGMMLLCMYLERTFGLSSLHRSSSASSNSSSSSIQKRDQQALYRLISLVCYAPMLLACFVAASRVVDNKHFPADVVGGALLGGSVASLIFGIWFPNQPNNGVW